MTHRFVLSGNVPNIIQKKMGNQESKSIYSSYNNQPPKENNHDDMASSPTRAGSSSGNREMDQRKSSTTAYSVPVDLVSIR